MVSRVVFRTGNPYDWVMSWVADMRCLYCDAKLPLYRKITSGQFCSTAHRRAYWQEQERLAVERLHQTHNSLRAYRPPGAVEAVLGQADSGLASDAQIAFDVQALARSASNTDRVTVAGFLRDPALVPRYHENSGLDPAARQDEIEPVIWTASSALSPVERTSPEQIWPEQIWPNGAAPRLGRIPAAGAVKLSLTAAAKPRKADAPPPARSGSAPRREVAPVAATTRPMVYVALNATPDTPELRITELSIREPRAPELLAPELPIPESSVEAEPPVPRCEHLFAIPVPSSTTGRVGVPPDANAAGASSARREPLPIAVIVRSEQAIETFAQLFCSHHHSTALASKHFPSAAMHPLTLDRALAHEAADAKSDPLPLAVTMRAQVPLDALRAQRKAAALGSAQLPAAEMRPLALDRTPLVHGIWTDQARGLDFGSEGSSPVLMLSTPAQRPRLRLAAGSRYPVGNRYQMEGREGNVAVAEVEPARVMVAPPHIPLPPNVAAPIRVPNAGGLLPLACNAKPSQPPSGGVASPEIFTIPQPLNTAPIRPGSKLEPLDAKPVSDHLRPPPSESGIRSGLMPYPGDDSARKANVWAHAVDFWEHAPRDLKMLAFAIPILLGLALHPGLPKVRVTAPATTGGLERDFKRTLDEQMVTVKHTVAERAAVALDEDFRSGLDDWTSRGDLTTSWSFDENGFVKPGPLAIYRPTAGLTDYQMQFLGIIDEKALSWVVRAADYDNYYVVKLVVLKPGPLPTIGVTRYAVIDGKAQDRADTIAPINARPDMLYRVRVDVNDDRFVLTVQGQLVDSWSESRLKRGGIGFFSARGEESRVRWVQVTHQYDMLGRLCAYLAPYNIPSTNGSW